MSKELSKQLEKKTAIQLSDLTGYDPFLMFISDEQKKELENYLNIVSVQKGAHKKTHYELFATACQYLLQAGDVREPFSVFFTARTAASVYPRETLVAIETNYSRLLTVIPVKIKILTSMGRIQEALSIISQYEKRFDASVHPYCWLEAKLIKLNTLMTSNALQLAKKEIEEVHAAFDYVKTHRANLDTRFYQALLKIEESQFAATEGDTENSVKYCKEALDIGRELKNLELQAAAHLAFSIGLNVMQKEKPAYRHIESALEFYQELGDRSNVAFCMGSIAMSKVDKGHLDGAIKDLKQVLEIYGDLEDSFNFAQFGHFLIYAYLNRDDQPKAKQIVMEIDQRLKNFPDIDLFLANNLIYDAIECNEIPLAKKYLDIAEQALRRNQTPSNEADLLFSRSKVAQAESNLKEAISWAEKALNISQEHKLTGTLISCNFRIGIVSLQSAIFECMNPRSVHFAKALESFTNIKNLEPTATVQIEIEMALAGVNLLSDNFQKVKEHTEKAFELANQLQDNQVWLERVKGLQKRVQRYQKQLADQNLATVLPQRARMSNIRTIKAGYILSLIDQIKNVGKTD